MGGSAEAISGLLPGGFWAVIEQRDDIERIGRWTLNPKWCGKESTLDPHDQPNFFKKFNAVADEIFHRLDVTPGVPWTRQSADLNKARKNGGRNSR